MSNVKTYTVKEFCKKYNSLSNEQIKASLIKDIIKSHYVSYEMKITICEKIVENSYYITLEKNGTKIKKFHSNSPIRYMLYCLNLIKYYTYIDVDFSNSLEEFNLLNKFDLFNIIYNEIPEREFKEFGMILDMVENDVVQNEYETHAFISNQLDRFSELIGFFIKPAINQFNDVIKNVDQNTANTLLNILQKSK